tara:strand:- start:1669 stop:3636 length:1968 start_codon:yes stop_codon:yes gene_type:complete
MEFGRVVSDAPYGIRGMANNVSQLTSLLFQGAGAIDETTGKVIGLKGAIKGMWGAMMGPLGIMIGIQAVIAILDHFLGSTEKAAGGADDYATSIKELTDTLDDLEISQENVNDKIDEYIALKEKKELVDTNYEKNAEQIKANKAEIKTIEEGIALNDLMIANTKQTTAQQKIQARNRKQHLADIEALREANRKLYLEDVKLQDDYNKSKEAFNDAEEGTLRFLKQLVSKDKKIRETLSDTSKEYEKLTVVIEKNQKKIDAIQGVKKKGGGSSTSSKTNDSYKAGFLDTEKIYRDHSDRLNDLITIGERERLQIRHDEQKRDLKQLLVDFTAKEDARLLDFTKKQQKVLDDATSTAAEKEIANALIIEAEKTHQINLAAAQKGLKSSEGALDSAQLVESMNLDVELQKNQSDHDMKMRLLQIEQDSWVTENGRTFQVYKNDERIAARQDQIDQSNWRLQEFTMSNAQILAEAKLQAKLLGEIQDIELSDTLAVEGAKASVKDEAFKLGITGMKNMSLMMKKDSEEQKAFALLSIAAKTAEGISNGVIIAQDAAQGGGPAAPFIMASVMLSQTAAVLGAAAQAKAILAGGNGGGTSVASNPFEAFNPNFNVVGNSNENQLAQGIGNQVNEPTRAYVVYEDIQEAGEINDASEDASGL